MDLPELEQPTRYEGLYIYDCGEWCAVGYTAAEIAVLLESDEYRIPIGGRLRVYRSRDAGESWTPLAEGLPSEHVYASVMRGAMDADQLEPCGIYVGTTSGDVFVSADAGDHWTVLPYRLPRIHCLSAFAEG